MPKLAGNKSKRHTKMKNEKDGDAGLVHIGTIPDRDIFWFYEWGLKWVPVALMAAHWYGVLDFHANPREIFVDAGENEACIAYLYVMAYVFPLMFMMPASFFYRLCWVWRVPFVYLIGVNVTRLCYGSLLIRNEMEMTDYTLILLSAGLYAYYVARRLCSVLWRRL